VFGAGGPAPQVFGLRQPTVSGKFLSVEAKRFWVRGVTYGTFRPGPGGAYPDEPQIAADFAAIAAAGFNTVRTYTVPPRRLLDTAALQGLRVLIGLPWEQHITFLDDRHRRATIEARVRSGVRACAGHPAVLAYAIGNEIPASIVRWHGAPAIERFLADLAATTREQDPDGLLTYVNYPTTEYLQLDFADLVCFNVYLESREPLEAYIARLHNVAGERPLLLTEIGLDSRRHGERRQAETLAWQVRTAFAGGCAGAFLFAWTDEWHRGGHDIEDWDFGLTDRARRPKAALASVQQAMADVPFGKNQDSPRVSVVVCTYNGARTIRDCLNGLLDLAYPDFEVIVVDDGSTDATARIAGEYPFRLIRTPNRGLSSARNTGLAAASGEIVAYIDDDAWPDPHWLHYLVQTLSGTAHAGVGGPNLPPPGDGFVADAVALAPGGPMHVLLSDRVAEHVPGCNMAFRRDCLVAIGGFDTRFRTAGDDVDVCWRLQDQGWTLGFSAAAVVWHHRRNSVRAYWRQQRGYGRAEALLEAKWPERYNALGHAGWSGRLYGPQLARVFGRRGRIYQGTWGTAPFQSIYEPASGLLSSLVAMPEWALVVGALALLSVMAAGWRPLLLALPLLVAAVAAPVARAVASGAAARLRRGAYPRAARLRLRALIAGLHLLQPLARLRGRLGAGLTLWRRRGPRRIAPPWSQDFQVWSETWCEPSERLRAIEAAVRAVSLPVARGGDWDDWDLQARTSAFGGARLVMATEEHGAGRQFARFRLVPYVPTPTAIAMLTIAGLAAAAYLDGAWVVAGLFGAAILAVTLRAVADCGAALAAFRDARHVLEAPAAKRAPVVARPRAAPVTQQRRSA
jgi:O-antigen biosynthesis protein